MTATRVTGLVLAGGRATRMGSVDKGLQPLDDRPFVAHAIGRLASQVHTIVVSANRHQDDYAVFGYPVVGDLFGDHQGPLAGIHAGLATCGTGFLVVVPCDAPDFPLDLVARLAVPLADPAIEVSSAITPERAHPIFCMMRTTVTPALVDFLATGQRSVHRWIGTMANRAVSFADEDAFRNVNTTDELADARARRR